MSPVQGMKILSVAIRHHPSPSITQAKWLRRSISVAIRRRPSPSVACKTAPKRGQSVEFFFQFQNDI